MSGPYEDNRLVKEADGKPMPQYYNRDKDEMEPIEGRDGATLFHETGTVVYDMWKGSSNTVREFDKPVHLFFVANDSTNPLTFIVNGLSMELYEDEKFCRKFRPFTTVEIVCDGPYRAYVCE